MVPGKEMELKFGEDWKHRFDRQKKFLPHGLSEMLGHSSVYLAGVGAFGGVAASILAKTGISQFIISDAQKYELDSIVGQLLANTETIGRDKTQVAKETIFKINPEAKVKIVASSHEEPGLEAIIREVDVVVMGMDTLSEGIACYRAARRAKKPVVDFLFFPCPNISSTFPHEPMPEERFDYPTLKLNTKDCDDAKVAEESMLRLLSYGFATIPEVFTESQAFIPDLLPSLINLDRPIPTFAPMTAEIGVLLAREAIACIAKQKNIPFPRVGWPAYYIDLFQASSRVPTSPYLKETVGWEYWFDRLKQMKRLNNSKAESSF